jgi:hypothetical protein
MELLMANGEDKGSSYGGMTAANINPNEIPDERKSERDKRSKRSDDASSFVGGAKSTSATNL